MSPDDAPGGLSLLRGVCQMGHNLGGWQKSLPTAGTRGEHRELKNARAGRVWSWPKPASGIRKFTPT